MYKFYRQVIVIFCILVILTSLMAYACLELTFFSDPLLPAQKSAIPWKQITTSDAQFGGASSISANDSIYSLDFDFTIIKKAEHPYISYLLAFENDGSSETFVDLTRYSTLSFSVKCNPDNVLSFVIHTFDEKITKLNDPSTYRIPTAYFSCEDSWKNIEIDLNHLEIPEWWLRHFNVELSNQDYALNRVQDFSFGVSHQNPAGIASNVKIRELSLHGNDWRYMYLLTGVSVIIWLGFLFWLFKMHTKFLIVDIQEKMRKNRPLIEYQHLSIEPRKKKEKNIILRFMATEYANPNLTLEIATVSLGMTRTKINEILKQEMGFTFNVYLNKLRLSESARLLSEKREASVADIAYSVGYNNVSYFNKLFKSEYGCTPKKFKDMTD